MKSPLMNSVVSGCAIESTKRTSSASWKKSSSWGSTSPLPMWRSLVTKACSVMVFPSGCQKLRAAVQRVDQGKWVAELEHLDRGGVQGRAELDARRVGGVAEEAI